VSLQSDFDNDSDCNDILDELFDPPCSELDVELLPSDNIFITQIVKTSIAPPSVEFEEYDSDMQPEQSTQTLWTETQFSNSESITIYKDAVMDVQYTGVKQTYIHDYPTILETSCYFELNRKQHQSFVKHALHLLQIWCRDSKIPEDSEFLASYDSTPIASHIIGPAGFGKSKIIDALLEFAKLWNKEGSVLATAFYGTAAENAKGIHLHALFGWPLHYEHKLPNEYNTTRLSRLRLLIIDEASTLPQRLLGCVSTALCHVFKSNALMGGIDYSIVGIY
jgi:hypothetical protein